MDTKESVELYEKGVEAWNAWANEMLAEKAELVKTGRWQVCDGGNEATKDWGKRSAVDFFEHTFSEVAVFDNFIFPFVANFSKVTFSDSVMFFQTKFRDKALFAKTKFQNAAYFATATFSDTIFMDAIFDDCADFDDATFNDNISFIRTSFNQSVYFSRTTFRGFSYFTAIEGKSFFSFRNAKFHLVPDFNQAHFTEAPQFDDADFSKALNRSQDESNVNLSSRWRALKRLAIQGHDHERELIFFAEEIKSQRGIQDKAFPNPVNYFNNEPVWPGGARYWFGYLYQYSSDFGRSVMRPLFWLMVLGFLFQVLYLKYPVDSEPQENTSCNRSEAATYLSVRSASPFLPATSYSENLSRSYACLYGRNSDGKENIPNAIVFISIFQTILSTILIFLLLLALRNRFRIK